MADAPQPSYDAPETIIPDVKVEHLYAPYCAGFRVVRLLERIYQLKVIAYNLVELRGTKPILPPHVDRKYREIVGGGRVPYGGLFFVNEKYVGSAFQDAIFRELDRLGVPKVGEPFEPLPHPRLLDQAQARGTLLIRAMTMDDTSGHGNPSPAYCTELQFGAHGNQETVGLLAGWTSLYGCCMLGAYLRGQAAGFVTFVPREELWRLGWYENLHEPPERGERAKVLSVICLHVYPGARRRGVATALLSELIEYGRDHHFQRIIAYTGCRHMNTIGQSAGNRFPYEQAGFSQEKILVQPGPPRTPEDTSSRQYQGLAMMVHTLK